MLNKPQTILAAINVIGFIFITIIAFMAVKFGDEWAKAMMQNILPLLVGCWIVNVTTIINYVYGSSQASSTKNAVIEKLITDK